VPLIHKDVLPIHFDKLNFILQFRVTVSPSFFAKFYDDGTMIQTTGNASVGAAAVNNGRLFVSTENAFSNNTASFVNVTTQPQCGRVGCHSLNTLENRLTSGVFSCQTTIQYFAWGYVRYQHIAPFGKALLPPQTSRNVRDK
jgi:hypothetical protein